MVDRPFRSGDTWLWTFTVDPFFNWIYADVPANQKVVEGTKGSSSCYVYRMPGKKWETFRVEGLDASQRQNSWSVVYIGVSKYVWHLTKELGWASCTLFVRMVEYYSGGSFSFENYVAGTAKRNDICEAGLCSY